MASRLAPDLANDPERGSSRPTLAPQVTFEALYEKEFDFVWRTLRRLGVPEADLPDVVQEVFIVVHRRLPEFEGRAKATTWLFRISLGVARDRRRRAHVRREVLDPELFDGIADPADDASRELERVDELRLFDAALEGMDLDQRAVFTLFELEGLSGQSIAETLQIPLGTVYSRLRLARAAFQSNLKRHAARARWQRLQAGERS